MTDPYSHKLQEEILEPFGEHLITDLRVSLRKKGVIYGGQDSKLAADRKRMRYTISTDSDPIRFGLILPEYAEALNSGRGKTKTTKAGSPTLKENLEDWVSRKGIVKKFQERDLAARRVASSRKDKANIKMLSFADARSKLAGLIAKKIHNRGYKGNHFYDDVINDGRLTRLKTELTNFFQKEVIIDILK
jgi:hypothetical protein